MIIFINIATKGDVFYPGGYVRVFCSQTIHVCTKCTDAWFTTQLFYHTCAGIFRDFKLNA